MTDHVAVEVTQLHTTLGSSFSWTTAPQSNPGNVTSGIGVPVLWAGRPVFYIIHVTAIVSCYASGLASVVTLVFLFVNEQFTKRRRFYRWTIGERLVVYLALADLLYSLSHGSDHLYLVANTAKPPHGVCLMFAVLTNLFMLDQGLTVLYTAFSAFLLVYYHKKIHLGRFDWRLIIFTLVPPFIFSALGLVYDYLGFNGLWCVETAGTLGTNLSYVRCGIQGFVFTVSVVCYSGIWLKIRSSGPDTETAQDKERKKKYRRSAKVMVIFVLVYIFQWWPLFAYYLWLIWAPPPQEFFVTLVFIVNFGGVYNGLAYTLMRRKYLSQTRKRPDEGNIPVTAIGSPI